MEKFWLYLEPYVHATEKAGEVLLYNPLNARRIESIRQPEITALVRRLLSPKNLRVIPLSGKQLKSPDVAAWIASLRKHYFGDLVERGLSEGRPVQLVPRVKVDESVPHLKTVDHAEVGRDAMSYLTELTLVLNNQCHQTCPTCSGANRQFMWCGREPGPGQELSIEIVKAQLKGLTGSELQNLNITGGNILDYSFWPDMVKCLRSAPFQKTYYLHYANALRAFGGLRTLAGSRETVLKLLVSHLSSGEDLSRLAKKLRQLPLAYEIVFLVETAADYRRAEQWARAAQLDEWQGQPYYNGRNLSFFEKNVFIERKDFDQSGPSANDIYTNHVLNRLQFGCLTIASDGSVYANMHDARLGHIERDSLSSLVVRELVQGKSWFKIRGRVKPCRRCNYVALCPPLSNYEIVLKRNNLCHIR